MSKAHLYVKTADGRDVPVIGDQFGNVAAGGASGGGGQSAAATADTKGWAYAAASGGITDTSDVTLESAPGAKMHNYITAIQVINKHASTGTEIVVKSGSTILFRQWAGEGGNGFVITFPRPLVAAVNTALTAACITNSTATYINAQGFIAGPPNQAAVEITPVDELLDDNGAYVTDDSGNNIYVSG
jgi:hypothetical protein